MKPLVSIIVPNYNHRAFLHERMQSILCQTYQNFELIILDDASTDDSVDYLDRLENHPRVSAYLKNTINSGSPFKQWKKGLELANGDYVWIAESDDSCELDFLESQIENLEEFDIVVADTRTMSQNQSFQKRIAHPAFRREPSTTLSVENFLSCPVSNISAALFRNIDKAALSGSKFDQYSIIGDVMFYYEFFAGKRIAYNADTNSYFRVDNDGVSNLATKDLKYFDVFLTEHFRFIQQVSMNERDKLENLPKRYIKKKLKKVRKRTSARQKLSFRFWRLYLRYRWRIATL